MREDEIRKQNMSLNTDAWVIMGIEEQKASVPYVALVGLLFCAVQKTTTKPELHWVEEKVLFLFIHRQEACEQFGS